MAGDHYDSTGLKFSSIAGGSARIGSICNTCGFEICQCADKPYIKGLTPGPIEQAMVTGLKPHKCPVCDGRGLVAFLFYDTDTISSPNITTKGCTPEQCRSCKGAGVLWST